MGLSYSAYLRVGFIIKWDALMKVVRTQTAQEVYRSEDRFDPKTGQKIAPVQVLESCAEYEFRLGGELLCIEDEDPDSFTKILGAKLGAEVNTQFGEDNVFITVPSEELEWVGDVIDCGRVTFGSHLAYDAVLRVAPTVERIRKKLVEFGFDPGRPLVIMDTTIC